MQQGSLLQGCSLLFACLALLPLSTAEDATRVNLDDVVGLDTAAACPCLRSQAVYQKTEEYLRVILRVNSVRLATPLQTLSDQANAEIHSVLDRFRWKLYEGIRTNFPRLLTQPTVSDSIEEMIGRIRNQLFVPSAIDSEISPGEIEKAMEVAVQNFFMQILPPTFLCIASGPCRTVTQSYANCLQNNAPFWAKFYGNAPRELPAELRNQIFKFRLIQQTTERLFNYVVDSESVNRTCVSRFAAVTRCAPECAHLDGVASVGYCMNSCKDAVKSCLSKDLDDWDTFLSILHKLSDSFNEGFNKVDKEIIRSIAHAMEVQAPSLISTMFLKCGNLKLSKTIPQSAAASYSKPKVVPKKAAQMIRQLSTLKGSWQRFVASACMNPPEYSRCWNGSHVILSAEISSDDKAMKASEMEVPSGKGNDFYEGSGNLAPWSDDEDFAEGSGSGAIDPVEELAVEAEVRESVDSTSRPPVTATERPTETKMAPEAPKSQTKVPKRASRTLLSSAIVVIVPIYFIFGNLY